MIRQPVTPLDRHLAIVRVRVYEALAAGATREDLDRVIAEAAEVLRRRRNESPSA